MIVFLDIKVGHDTYITTCFLLIDIKEQTKPKKIANTENQGKP